MSEIATDARSSFGSYSGTGSMSRMHLVAYRLEFLFACGTVFFAPMNFLRMPSFYFTVGDGFATLCLLAMLFNATLNLRALGPGTGYWISGLALMVGALMTSSLFADVTDRAIILCGQYLFAYLVLPLILLARPWRETTILMKVFVTSIVIMVLHGIYVVDYLGERNTQFVGGSGRLLGFVERENEFASLVALSVPMLLAMAATRMINPVLAFLIVPLLTYGIMLTGSNTGLLSLTYGVGLFMLFRLTFVKTILVLAGMQLLWFAINLPALQVYLPAVFRRRVLGGLVSGDVNELGTFSDRMALIKEAAGIAETKILLGVGADQYREISAWHAPVHNLYLLLWSEGGVLALAGFLVMLTGGVIVIVQAFGRTGGRTLALCAFTTLTLFAALVNAVPHVYGRFWTVPVILSLAPAVALLQYGLPRRTPRA
jgi:hypothetical protein